MNVLVLARSYPNSVAELQGLWVQNIVSRSTAFSHPTVISPIPYCPPLPGIPDKYRKFRKVAISSVEGGIEVYRPRLLVGPGYTTYSRESSLYHLAVRRLADRLWRKQGFDLIHAHFTYPDGVVAMQLAGKYSVPVVITEHIPWNVWDSEYKNVQKQAGIAAAGCYRHISVSPSVRGTVEAVLGKLDNLTVVSNAVDGTLFTTAGASQARPRNRVLFAGAVRPVKGVDVLIRAMKILRERGSQATLEIAGEPYFETYRKEEWKLRAMVSELQLDQTIRFTGKKMPHDLAALMRDSSVLVLPSRAESFGVVLAEALACGTPVVSTRCGGPEDIVNDAVGVLVNCEDPEALASGIQHVLDHPNQYDPEVLRSYAIARFGIDAIGNRISDIYQEALTGRARRQTSESLPCVRPETPFATGLNQVEMMSGRQADSF